mmetsp:Transcript_70752/g.205115  ORF Transcript_70752/g.205115 Transcript_70752/m.205115 type:complete len:251 (-) Transcript_70752:567-1319(-)
MIKTWISPSRSAFAAAWRSKTFDSRLFFAQDLNSSICSPRARRLSLVWPPSGPPTATDERKKLRASPGRPGPRQDHEAGSVARRMWSSFSASLASEPAAPKSGHNAASRDRTPSSDAFELPLSNALEEHRNTSPNLPSQFMQALMLLAPANVSVGQPQTGCKTGIGILPAAPRPPASSTRCSAWWPLQTAARCSAGDGNAKAANDNVCEHSSSAGNNREPGATSPTDLKSTGCCRKDGWRTSNLMVPSSA